MQSKPVLILLGLLVLFFAWNILGFWNKMQETEKNKKIAEDKITSLQQQKDQLSSKINSLNTEEGKEAFIRGNYDLVKQGEGEIIIMDDQNPPPVPKPALSGFFGFLKNIFK
jgi:cell division protein FtsB